MKYYVLLSSKGCGYRNYEWQELKSRTIENARKEVKEICKYGEFDEVVITKHVETL